MYTWTKSKQKFEFSWRLHGCVMGPFRAKMKRVRVRGWGIREFEHSAIKQPSPVYVFAIRGLSRSVLSRWRHDSHAKSVSRAYVTPVISRFRAWKTIVAYESKKSIGPCQLYLQRPNKASAVSNENIESLLPETCGSDPVKIRMLFARLVNSISCWWWMFSFPVNRV